MRSEGAARTWPDGPDETPSVCPDAAAPKIAELEAQIEHLMAVAVGMMSGVCFSNAHTPEGLRELAKRWAVAGDDPDPALSELARLLEAALREAAEKVRI